MKIREKCKTEEKTRMELKEEGEVEKTKHTKRKRERENVNCDEKQKQKSYYFIHREKTINDVCILCFPPRSVRIVHIFQ